MTVVDRHRQRSGVARLVGDHDRLRADRRRENQLVLVVQDDLFIVHSNRFEMDLGHGHGLRRTIGFAVLHAGNGRFGRVQHHAVRPQPGHIAGFVGQPRIHHKRPVRMDAERRIVVSKLLIRQLLDGQILVGQQIRDGDILVAVVRRGDGHRLRIGEEQAKADGVQEALPAVALVNANLAGGQRFVDLISFGHRFGDRAVAVLHIEGQRAVVRRLRYGQLVAPLAIRRVGQRQTIPLLRRHHKVGVLPIVGVNGVLLAGSDVRLNTSGDAARLGQGIVADERAVAKQGEISKVDRDLLAHCHAVKGGHAVQQLHRVVIHHTDQRRRAVDLGGVGTIVQLVFDFQIVDGQRPSGNIRRRAGGLRCQRVVRRRRAGQRKLRKGHRFAGADIPIAVMRLAGHNGEIIAIVVVRQRSRARDVSVGRPVVNFGSLHSHIVDRDGLFQNFIVVLDGNGLVGIRFGDRNAQGVFAGICRHLCAVSGILRPRRFILDGVSTVGVGGVGRGLDRLPVVLFLEFRREETHARRRFFHCQLQRGHRRCVTGLVCFAHRVVRHAEGIFARRQRRKIAVFQRDRSVFGHGVLCAVDRFGTVIQRRHGVAVQLHLKAHIVFVPHSKAYGTGDRLSIRINHHPIGIDDLHIAAVVGHPDIDRAFLVRLNSKACLATVERQRRPIAGDGGCVLKRGFRQQIFHPADPAARIARLDSDCLGLLKKQTKGDGVYKGFERVGTDSDLRFGRGGVRHTENGHNNIARHSGNGVAAGIGLHRSTVHIHHKTGGFGIALGNLHRKGVISAVTGERFAGDFVALTARQLYFIKAKDMDGHAGGIARRIRCRNGVLLIIRFKNITTESQPHRIAVHRHGELVRIGNGKSHRAVVGFTVFYAGNDRRVGVGRCHIAAAAKLFVGIGFPNASMGVVYDLNISGDTHTAVDDKAVVHILKRLTLCKAVDKMLTINRDFFKFAAA